MVVEKYGKDNCLLVFADTNIEDEDNYRFLYDGAFFLETELVVLKNKKTPWDIYEEKRFVNHRVSNCSMELKIKPCRKFVSSNFSATECVLYFGIDFNEYHRTEKITKNWEPYSVDYPLCWGDWVDRNQIFQTIKDDGLKPPRLYEYGFSHANCGGFCSKAGKKQFRKLLNHFPERYMYHEKRENQFLELISKQSGCIIREKGGTLTLKQFRERIESESMQSNSSDDFIGGCGCFIED
ncbi:hypothetical protein [Okeania sp. KiyG1]|uniref:hypothetical protein n=1 Tax=Okeania sp. KiyG1 TaxID=2720165 RepID=UPI001F42554D|nr:hypothetical protein [Okeania sp. KiyG1]